MVDFIKHNLLSIIASSSVSTQLMEFLSKFIDENTLLLNFFFVTLITYFTNKMKFNNYKELLNEKCDCKK